MQLNYDLQNKKLKYCKIIKRRYMKPTHPIFRETAVTICKKQNQFMFKINENSMEKIKRIDQSARSLLDLFEDLQVKIPQSCLHINIYCRLFTVAKVWNQPKRLSNGGRVKMQPCIQS